MYFRVYISMYVYTYVKDPLLRLLLVSLGTGTKNFLSFFLRWRVNILYQIITEGHNHRGIFYFNSDTRIGYLLAPMCWFVSWLFYLYSNRKDKYFYFDWTSFIPSNDKKIQYCVTTVQYMRQQYRFFSINLIKHDKTVFTLLKFNS